MWIHLEDVEMKWCTPRLVTALLVSGALALTVSCGDNEMTSETGASASDGTAGTVDASSAGPSDAGSESDASSAGPGGTDSGTESSTGTDPTSVGPTSDLSTTDPTDATDTGVVECTGAQFECGGACCEPDQVCFLDQCSDDCGGAPPCGEAKDCCDMSEVCYLGACVVPGNACTEMLCATKDDPQQCDDGFVCDSQLGLCVPAKADPTCIYVPPQNVFEPVPLFTWGVRKSVNCNDDSQCQNAEVCENGKCAVTWPHVTIADDDAPINNQSSSIPLVVDVDDNCVPDIVFNTYRAGNAGANGVLRAIRGDTGEKIWSAIDPAFETDGTANPAAGDLDLDGLPEFVVSGEGKFLLAFDNDGTPLWQSDAFSGTEASGSVAIANLDGEGRPEVTFGRAVYDADGALLWQGTQGQGLDIQGPISCIADLDGDDRPELLAGRTAYSFTGTVAGNDFTGVTLWHSAVGDGKCGVADFDKDGLPEVILVRGGRIYALNGQTGVEIANINIPGSSDGGGAPNIADFDGDGTPDIGTAGSSRYVVVTFDGVSFTELWRATVEDDSSRVTGSSVFDFDGDGRNEVVYNDEKWIRIYPGVEPDCELNPPGPGCDGIMSDAEVLFRDRNTSRTRTEYPVIADVDGDFKAEIVFATNNDISWGLDTGLEVLQDSLDNWVSTRPVWNQHTYHITNVDDTGQIPLVEEDSWLWPMDEPLNSYRRNTQGAGDFCAPDLVPYDLNANANACPDLDLSVRVANEGCLGVGPGVNVSFYEANLGYLGTVQTQNAIPAGGSEQVFLFVDTDIMDGSIWAVVDDDGMGNGALNECVEDNNNSVEGPACQGVG
ncbi:MAG: VCBS repeat-containing protein [Myxococcales bacterium]|nr:VCBS repeat-containing protein [Myxococcales bacterium]